MKKLLLALVFVACEGPIEGDADRPDGVVGLETQMVRTHMGMEPKKAPALLPVGSPSKEIAQERWEALRTGSIPPLRVMERVMLGMDIKQGCFNFEACDMNNCDGVDVDGYNLDGVDQSEFDSINPELMALNWGNCTDIYRGGPYGPRCDHTSGGFWYTGTVAEGQPVASTTFAGQHYWFTGADFTGWCIMATNEGYGYVSNLGDIYPGNVFKDSISSFRWGGGCTSGYGQRIQLWDYSGFPGWPWNATWTSSNGPTWLGHLNIVGWDNKAAGLKVCL